MCILLYNCLCHCRGTLHNDMRAAGFRGLPAVLLLVFRLFA